MSLKLIKILIIFLYFKNPTIFADNHENIHALPFNYTPSAAMGAYRMETHTLAKYVVSIRQAAEPARLFGFSHFCAGSIIEANRILTAAHCVFSSKNVKTKPSAIKVVAKTYIRLERNSNTEEIAVKKIIFHSKYSRPSRFHDIAVLILDKDIKLDGILAAKISLPKHDIKKGKLCTVVGWGKMYENGPMANNLLYGDIHLLDRSYCRKWLPNISSKKICAFNKYDDEINICKGDSGGPLICSNGKDVVVGIVSYGYGCAKGIPGVYTNVYRYLDWIKEAKGSHLQPLPNMLCFCVIASLCILQ